MQVAEKGRCLLRLTMRAEGGHSATPRRGSAIARLAEALCLLERRRLPTHITPSVRLMVREMAKGLPRGQAQALQALLRPRLTDLVLRGAGAQAEDLQPLFRNAAVATVVRAGEATNVMPDAASATRSGFGSVRASRLSGQRSVAGAVGLAPRSRRRPRAAHGRSV
ncbi:MAG: peptidase dimerization domain-containing protein [Actinomycetota bacterium]|nr:peptidase dimerization domain-containing protein [Actinomycetota bacterium]